MRWLSTWTKQGARHPPSTPIQWCALPHPWQHGSEWPSWKPELEKIYLLRGPCPDNQSLPSSLAFQTAKRYFDLLDGRAHRGRTSAPGLASGGNAQTILLSCPFSNFLCDVQVGCKTLQPFWSVIAVVHSDRNGKFNQVTSAGDLVWKPRHYPPPPCHHTRKRGVIQIGISVAMETFRISAMKIKLNLWIRCCGWNTLWLKGHLSATRLCAMASVLILHSSHKDKHHSLMARVDIGQNNWMRSTKPSPTSGCHQERTSQNEGCGPLVRNKRLLSSKKWPQTQPEAVLWQVQCEVHLPLFLPHTCALFLFYRR